MLRTCSQHGKQKRETQQPKPDRAHPFCSLSGSVEGAVFVRTQAGPAITVKELSKEFIKVTGL